MLGIILLIDSPLYFNYLCTNVLGCLHRFFLVTLWNRWNRENNKESITIMGSIIYKKNYITYLNSIELPDVKDIPVLGELG